MSESSRTSLPLPPLQPSVIGGFMQDANPTPSRFLKEARAAYLGMTPGLLTSYGVSSDGANPFENCFQQTTTNVALAEAKHPNPPSSSDLSSNTAIPHVSTTDIPMPLDRNPLNIPMSSEQGSSGCSTTGKQFTYHPTSQAMTNGGEKSSSVQKAINLSSTSNGPDRASAKSSSPAIEMDGSQNQEQRSSQSPPKKQHAQITPIAETSSIGPAAKRKRKTAAADIEDEAERKRFLERNRIAANRCREKKRQMVQDLERRTKDAETRHQELKATVAALNEELLALKKELEAHKDCGCDLVRKYFELANAQTFKQ